MFGAVGHCLVVKQAGSVVASARLLVAANQFDADATILDKNGKAVGYAVMDDTNFQNPNQVYVSGSVNTNALGLSTFKYFTATPDTCAGVIGTIAGASAVLAGSAPSSRGVYGYFAGTVNIALSEQLGQRIFLVTGSDNVVVACGEITTQGTTVECGSLTNAASASQCNQFATWSGSRPYCTANFATNTYNRCKKTCCDRQNQQFKSQVASIFSSSSALFGAVAMMGVAIGALAITLSARRSQSPLAQADEMKM
jgi:hypothetical protein